MTPEGVIARAFRDESSDRVDERDPVEKPRSREPLQASRSIEKPRTPAGRAPALLRVLVGLLGFALGAIVWLILAVVEFAGWTLVLPPRSLMDAEIRSEDAAPGEPERLIVHAADGARLAGRWLPAPEPAATGRTVLLLHGFENSTKWETRRAVIL